MLPNLKAAWLITTLTSLAGITAYLFSDPGSLYPVHWDAGGNVDRMGSALEAFLAVPAIQLLTLILLWGIRILEPRKTNLEKSARAYSAIATSVILFLALLQTMMIAPAFGLEAATPNLLIAGAGLLFTVIGNYLGKLRSSFFIGIRTPWTLSSDVVWRKTNRLGGRIFVLCGIALFIAALTLPIEILPYVLLGLLLPAVLFVTAYSWFIWRQEPH